jgi:uncharacterized lipoprotein YmbA
MNAFTSSVVFGLVLVGGLAACSSPSPAPVLLSLPPVLALRADADAAAAAAASASAPLLAVRRVVIPEYLLSRRVRYRADASTLAEWPNTFWAERIEIGLTREFVAALHQQLPGWSMCEMNCGDQVPALTLQLDLVPLDYVRSERTLRSLARITLSGAGVLPKVLRSTEQRYELQATADTAQAQAELLARLIQQAATAAAPMVNAAKP